MAFLLRGEDTLQLPFRRFLYDGLSPIAGGTRFGVAFITMELGFAFVTALLFLAWLTDKRVLLWPVFILGLCLASGLSLSGHSAADAGHSWLSELADWVHLSAAILWIGGLVQLVAVVWPAAPELRRTAFLRFPRLATVPVALLLVAGTDPSILPLPHVHAPWTTGYGHVLLEARARGARARVGRRPPPLRCRGSTSRRHSGFRACSERAPLRWPSALAAVWSTRNRRRPCPRPPAAVQRKTLMRGARRRLTSFPMIVLTRSDVEALLDLDELEDTFAQPMQALSVFRYHPHRGLGEETGLLGAMPRISVGQGSAANSSLFRATPTGRRTRPRSCASSIGDGRRLR